MRYTPEKQNYKAKRIAVALIEISAEVAWGNKKNTVIAILQ